MIPVHEDIWNGPLSREMSQSTLNVRTVGELVQFDIFGLTGTTTEIDLSYILSEIYLNIYPKFSPQSPLGRKDV